MAKHQTDAIFSAKSDLDAIRDRLVAAISSISSDITDVDNLDTDPTVFDPMVADARAAIKEAQAALANNGDPLAALEHLRMAEATLDAALEPLRTKEEAYQKHWQRGLPARRPGTKPFRRRRPRCCIHSGPTAPSAAPTSRAPLSSPSSWPPPWRRAWSPRTATSTAPVWLRWTAGTAPPSNAPTGMVMATRTWPKAVANSCNPAFIKIGQALGCGKVLRLSGGTSDSWRKPGIDMLGEQDYSSLIWPQGINSPGVDLAVASFGQRFR